MASARGVFNSWDALKVVALLLMFVDHAGIFIFNSDAEAHWLRAIGRGAAPIFLFLAGYARSYRLHPELLALALGFTVFDWIYFRHINTLNILWSILIYRALFQWFEMRGRVIRRPAEWFVGGVSLFMTGVITQYGSIGFLIALCGYMRRHAEAYPPRLRHGLTAVITVTYAFFQVYFFTPPIQPVVAALAVGGAMLWCSCFTLRDIRAPWLPAGGRRSLKLVSRYSGALYVGHLVLLHVATGIAA